MLSSPAGSGPLHCNLVPLLAGPPGLTERQHRLEHHLASHGVAASTVGSLSHPSCAPHPPVFCTVPPTHHTVTQPATCTYINKRNLWLRFVPVQCALYTAPGVPAGGCRCAFPRPAGPAAPAPPGPHPTRPIPLPEASAGSKYRRPRRQVCKILLKQQPLLYLSRTLLSTLAALSQPRAVWLGRTRTALYKPTPGHHTSCSLVWPGCWVPPPRPPRTASSSSSSRWR